MSARALRTLCPSCGGTVPRSEGSRAERCPYCSRRSVVVGEGPAAEIRYALPLCLEAPEASRALRAELVDKGVISRRIAGAIAPAEPTLYYVPFLWISGMRTGLVTREHRPLAQGKERWDTKVALDDFEVWKPAAGERGWGLEGLDIGSLLSRPDSPMAEPYDGAELRAQGIVIAPQEGFADLQQWGAAGPRGSVPDSEPASLIGERRRILFVPVWAIPYEVYGYHYEARLEGVCGELLSARGPEDPRWRVPLALASTAIPAFLLGKFLTMTLSFGGSSAQGRALGEAFGTVAWPGIVLLGLLLAALTSFAWSLLRYEAEHVYERGFLWSHQLGRPKATLSDRVVARVSALFGDPLDRRGTV